MKFKCIVEYEYPVSHKPPVKAELVLHGDRVVTDNIEPYNKQKQGKWIDEGVMADGYSQHAFRCSKCGNHISRIPSDMPKFCENCGAELETVGYWVPDWSESYGKDGFRCSMCARWTSEKEEKCRHCGARMGGDT